MGEKSSFSQMVLKWSAEGPDCIDTKLRWNVSNLGYFGHFEILGWNHKNGKAIPLWFYWFFGEKSSFSQMLLKWSAEGADCIDTKLR